MSKLISALIFTSISMVCLCSCKKDAGTEFLKRNTDHLSFNYSESSATFTVRATGNWSISIPDDGDWIKVSPDHGTGDGETYQTVQVTCLDNTGEEREGVILLQGSGQKDVSIAINQSNGVFEWKTAGNGAKFQLKDLFIQGSPSNAFIEIPYIKATGKETVKAAVTLSGAGAAGLTAPTNATTLEKGDGFLKIPIQGTPSTLGEVNVNVKINDQPFGAFQTITGIGQTILEQGFSKFPWGSDFIGNKAGITTTVATASMSIKDETKTCPVGTLGANGSGVTSTIRSSNPAFFSDIGMDGWTGYRNYMCPGYIQLGSAGSTAAEFGSLITPALNLPAGSHNLLIRFKLAVYNQPAPSSLVFGLVNKGTITGITTTTYASVNTIASVPIDMAPMQWADFTCVVKNATSASSLVIALPESLASGGVVGASRIYIDDINVSY